MLTTTGNLQTTELLKAGWAALVSQLGVANSLRFLLEYENGQENYSKFRKRFFAVQTVGQILEDMDKQEMIWQAGSAGGGCNEGSLGGKESEHNS
ncbi:MAG: hypothetical protein AB2L11_11960 [Syntrophobacteraceae bacterium]